MGEYLRDIGPLEVPLRVAGDGAGARVGEEQVSFRVDDHDAVGGALEEVCVALQRAQASFRLEARDRHLLRLIAERLHDARIAERDGHGVRHRPTECQFGVPEDEGVLGAQEEDAHGARFVEDGENRERAESAALTLVANELAECVGREIWNDEGLAAGEHLRDLGVVREIDGQVAELLVVAGGHDVTHVPRLSDEDDADPIDLRDLGDALDDSEEDAAKVEVRREGLGELEDEAGILFLLGEGVDDDAEAELPANARHELHRLEGLSNEVVCAGLESSSDLLRLPRAR